MQLTSFGKILFPTLLVSFLVSSCNDNSISYEPADVVYQNAEIIPIDGTDEVRSVMAVKSGLISYVGSNLESDLVGDNTRVVDMQGKTIIPGFYDAHSHMIYSGVQTTLTVNLNSPPLGTVSNMDELIAALKTQAADDYSGWGGWIVGSNYDDTSLAEKRHPTKDDLDKVSTSKPIYIAHSSGHIAVANSLALEMSGITKDTPDPEGGVIGKDDNGELTGILFEGPASKMVFSQLSDPTGEQMFTAAASAARNYVENGVTTANSGEATPGLIGLADAAAQTAAFPLNINLTPTLKSSAAAHSMTLNSSKVKVRGVKEFADGSIQGYTGHLHNPYFTPYHGDATYRGFPRYERNVLVEKVAEIHNKGWQIVVHTNGDAAIDDTLFAIEKALEAKPDSDARPVLVHAQMATEDQLDKMAKLGVIPSFFNLHVYYWGDRHRDIFLGGERAMRISPMASAAARGLKFTLHADTPVVPMNPLLMMWSAVNRQTSSGAVLGADQAISAKQALEALTINAAFQNGEEESKGSISVGKVADLTVLSGNPLTVPAENIRNLQVLETIVNGETVYTSN